MPDSPSKNEDFSWRRSGLGLLLGAAFWLSLQVGPGARFEPRSLESDGPAVRITMSETSSLAAFPFAAEIAPPVSPE